jgi:hypothetical protein
VEGEIDVDLRSEYEDDSFWNRLWGAWEEMSNTEI